MQELALNVMCNRREMIYICIGTIIPAQGSKRANPFQTDLSIEKTNAAWGVPLHMPNK